MESWDKDPDPQQVILIKAMHLSANWIGGLVFTQENASSSLVGCTKFRPGGKWDHDPALGRENLPTKGA